MAFTCLHVQVSVYSYNAKSNFFQGLEEFLFPAQLSLNWHEKDSYATDQTTTNNNNERKKKKKLNQ